MGLASWDRRSGGGGHFDVVGLVRSEPLGVGTDKSGKKPFLILIEALGRWRRRLSRMG